MKNINICHVKHQNVNLMKVGAVLMKEIGIFKEQVCILSAIVKTGNIITNFICKSRIKHTNLEH